MIDPRRGGRASDSGVRQQLRQATSVVHEALHQHPDFVSLINGRMTLQGYRALLARLYGFHRPFDAGLRAASPEVLRGFNVLERERSPALWLDLRYLGMSESEIDALPTFEGLGEVHSYPELMGRLYVVEGSALGGRVLAARLDGLLGPDENHGRLFFTGRTAPDPLSWAAFCRLLEGQAARSDTSAVIDGAETTFRALAHWLTEDEAHA